ncbi:MAG: sulfide dehydrogenase, cytochrome subunit [Pseudomonadota bacterium]
MKRALMMALVLAPGGVALGAEAAEEPAADAGALLAVTCAGCHREEASGPDGIPSLSGQSVSEIARKLTAYRSGELQGTLMNRLARGYSEDEIKLLAEALGTPARAEGAGE